MDGLKGVARGISVPYNSGNMTRPGYWQETGVEGKNQPDPEQGAHTGQGNGRADQRGSQAVRGDGRAQVSRGTQAAGEGGRASQGIQAVREDGQASRGTQAAGEDGQASRGTQAAWKDDWWQAAWGKQVPREDGRAQQQGAQAPDEKGRIMQEEMQAGQENEQILQQWLQYMQQGGQTVRQRTRKAQASQTARENGQGEQKPQSVLQKRQEEQKTAWLMYQEMQEKKQKEKDSEEEGYSLIAQLKEQAEAIKKAFDPKKRRNLYDATMDLTLIAQAEKIAALKAIQTRLFFQVRSVKASGAEASEIRSAVSKLKKVIGKAKAKVKSLKEEEEMEKKRKKAEEAKRKAKERALRRELELRKKVRKAKEQKDIEDSKMGLGANYGGPTGDPALDLVLEAYSEMNSAEVAMDVGTLVDVAVADVGTAAVDTAVAAVDVSV